MPWRIGGDAVQIRCKWPMSRVLIVDDDPAIRDVLRIALNQGGFQTVEAADGAAALAQFAAARPDIVVLDIMLPELDGTDGCRALRQRSAVPRRAHRPASCPRPPPTRHG